MPPLAKWTNKRGIINACQALIFSMPWFTIMTKIFLRKETFLGEGNQIYNLSLIYMSVSEMDICLSVHGLGAARIQFDTLELH